MLKIKQNPQGRFPNPDGTGGHSRPLLLFLTAMGICLWTSGATAISKTHPFSPTCSVWQCTPEMLRIEVQFQKNAKIQPSPRPKVYSGQCYHLSSAYDPNTIHYGMNFIFEENGVLRFSSSLGYFFSENPWADWTPEEAERRLDLSKSVVIEDFGNHSAVNLAVGYEDVVWQYWLSQNIDDASISFIGVLGVGNRVFCDLKLNKDK